MTRRITDERAGELRQKRQGELLWSDLHGLLDDRADDQATIAELGRLALHDHDPECAKPRHVKACDCGADEHNERVRKLVANGR